MRELRQSTAVTVKVGPFVDEAAPQTFENALTIQKADVKLSKNGGAYAAASADQGASDAGAAYDANGDYSISLDTTDTGTLGHLRLNIAKSGALDVWDDFEIVTANVWDSRHGTDKLEVDEVLFKGEDPDVLTDPIESNVVQANGSTTAVENLVTMLELLAVGAVDNTAHTPTTTEFESEEFTAPSASHYYGRTVYFKTGALAGQRRDITAYSLVGGRGHFTTAAFTQAPANNDIFIVA